MIKKIFIALVIFAALIAGGAFFMYYRVTSQAAKPLDIPDAASNPEVIASLKQRMEKIVASPAAGAHEPETVTLSSEELTALIAKLMPPIQGMRLALAIQNGRAQLKLSVPTKELTKLGGSEMDALAKQLVWLNVIARLDVGLVDGKLRMKVEEVREPSILSVAMLQGMLDQTLKSVPPGPLVVPIGDTPVKVTSLELLGSDATLKVSR